jgi:hypothetical protein
MGFPKAGVHALERMIQPIASPQPKAPVWDKPWAGTFSGNSFSADWVPLESTLFRIGRLQQGHYLLGHSGYHPDIERFIYFKGCTVVFVFRDFRDVAVSQAHHVLHEDDWTHAHPAKDVYRAMETFDDVLEAVIVGIDGFPGIMERWELYHEWLYVDWIHKVSYESLMARPGDFAKELAVGMMGRVAKVFGKNPTIEPVAQELLIKQMVHCMNETHLSPTFRQGTPGGWKEVFTDKHRDLFKRSDINSWLVRLGYEMEEDW